MDGRDTASAQPLFQTQIEIRCVDTNEDIRRIGAVLLIKLLPNFR